MWRGPSFATDPASSGVSAKQPPANQAIDLQTLRCLETLVAVASTFPTWIDPSVREQLPEKLKALASFNVKAVGNALADLDDPWGMLTCYPGARLVGALSRALYWSPKKDDLRDAGHLTLASVKQSASVSLAAEAVAVVRRSKKVVTSGRKDPGRTPHPFFVFATMRALAMIEQRPWEAAESWTADQSPVGLKTIVQESTSVRADLWGLMRPRVEELFARHQLGIINASESVALVFAAGAAGLAGRAARRHMDAALGAAIDTYTRAGGWQQGRVVAHERPGGSRGQRILVPSYEVFTALAETLRGLSDTDHEPPMYEAALSRVSAGLRLAEDAVVETTPGRPPGWSAEDLYDARILDPWATGSVLALSCASGEVEGRHVRRHVLAELNADRTDGADWPEWLQWDEYVKKSEPEQDVGILRFLDKMIVAPRKKEPLKSRSDPVVVLLFGPPGTTKTTIARSVANGLKWPLVTLSPGDFIEGGLENIEAQATEVFERLHKLSQAVVIFDECDELFRARSPKPDVEAIRGIAAFMTASMLPKLQDLHDRGRIVIFICTNFIRSIDPAMRRIGRIDHIVAVGWPDADQRRRTIETALGMDQIKGSRRRHVKDAVTELVKGSDRLIRGELVAAARELEAHLPFKNADQAVAAAQDIARRQQAASTWKTTAQEDIEQFEADRNGLSGPHRTKSAV